jgi:hypothetical protein
MGLHRKEQPGGDRLAEPEIFLRSPALGVRMRFIVDGHELLDAGLGVALRR